MTIDAYFKLTYSLVCIFFFFFKKIFRIFILPFAVIRVFLRKFCEFFFPMAKRWSIFLSFIDGTQLYIYISRAITSETFINALAGRAANWQREVYYCLRVRGVAILYFTGKLRTGNPARAIPVELGQMRSALLASMTRRRRSRRRISRIPDSQWKMSRFCTDNFRYRAVDSTSELWNQRNFGAYVDNL